MSELRWNKLVGQERVKGVIGSAFRNGTLGHAYLFCGERGTGKFAAAVDLAMALLCKGGGARPCGECLSCKKVLGYSHPDFHVIMPLVLSEEHTKKEDNHIVLTDEGWKFAADMTLKRLNDPYKLPQYAGIPNIPVDWIREANYAILRGATEGAANVAIIDGVDTMRKEAANAMLKTLEEPPPGTVMILLTDKINSVLPTIVSRCQIMRFALLPPDAVCAELHKRFVGEATDGQYDAKIRAAAASGSLGIAVEEYEDSLDPYYEAAVGLWNDCLRNDWEAAARNAEELSGGADALSSCRKTLKCLVQLLRFAFLQKFGAAGNNINLGQSYMIELPDAAASNDVERFAALCQSALHAIDARGNVMMAMVNFVCSLMETLNGEKQ